MDKRNKNMMARIWLILVQLFLLVTFLPWFAMFGLSFMAFDSGASLPAILFVIGIGSYPIISIVLSVLAWKSYRKGDIKKTVILGTIPIVIAIGFMLLII